MAPIASNMPVLPSRDLDRSAAFYARLGYRVARRFPDYAILSCGTAELHLAQAEVDPAVNPAGVYLRVTGLDAMARELGLAAEDKPWGQRELVLEDPDGALLRLGEPVGG